MGLEVEEWVDNKVVWVLKVFFEKFFGIGGSIAFTEQEPLVYNIDTKSSSSMAAESSATYNND